MFFSLVRDVEAIGFVQRSLFVGIDVDVALHTHLSHVSPTVPAHPLSFARGTLVFTEATFLALIWREAFSFWSGLQTRKGNDLKILCSSSFHNYLYTSLCFVLFLLTTPHVASRPISPHLQPHSVNPRAFHLFSLQFSPTFSLYNASHHILHFTISRLTLA